MSSALWFVSDVHIKVESSSRAQTFHNFLASLGIQREADYLFLLGDIFDLWVGNHPYWSQKKYPISVNHIKSVVQRGIEVIYLQGNHDVCAHKFWRHLGVEFVSDDFQITWKGKRILVSHGDFINPNEISYHNWIQWLRSRPAQFLADFIPAIIWDKAGSLWSQKSRTKSSYKGGHEDYLENYFIEYSRSQLEKKTFDLLVCGHIHKRIDHQLNDRVKAVNLGSWLNAPFAAYCLQDDKGFFVEL